MIVKVLPNTNGIALEFPYCLIRVISMSMGLIGCFKLTLLSHLRDEDHAVRFLRFLSDPSLPPCLEGSAFLCNLCGEKFSSIQDLQPHLDYHKYHKEGRKQCPVCHLWMRGNSSYRCHVRRHSDGKPFKCDKCSYETKQRTLFRRHVRVQHDKREKHACPVCPTELTSKNGLKLHLLRHTGEGKHKCSLCPSVSRIYRPWRTIWPWLTIRRRSSQKYSNVRSVISRSSPKLHLNASWRPKAKTGIWSADSVKRPLRPSVVCSNTSTSFT